jgi:uncharacterized protein YjbJ (UPF0337 family)
MSENKFSGTIDDINGKVQDAASGLTGDTGTQIRGKANQARGQAENILGDVAELIRDQPLDGFISSSTRTSRECYLV